jgi:hypothetical protein
MKKFQYLLEIQFYIKVWSHPFILGVGKKQEAKMNQSVASTQIKSLSCGDNNGINGLTCNWKNVVSKPAPRDNICFGFSLSLFFPALRN